MKNIQYILINEMSFIGPQMFVQIESHLCECFLEKINCSFENRSIILVGNLVQLPPVMEKHLYAGETLGKCLCTKFTIVIILETIFRQRGIDATQLRFC